MIKPDDHVLHNGTPPPSGTDHAVCAENPGVEARADAGENEAERTQPAPETGSPEPPHKLATIYGCDTAVYRRGESQAVVVLKGGAALVMHPWLWGGVSYRGNVETSERIEMELGKVECAVTVARGVATLGELLVWCSRRPEPRKTETVWDIDGECVAENEYWPEMDEQPVCGDSERRVCAINRWLVRECLQQLIEDGAMPERPIEMDLCPLNGGHVLRMRTRDTLIAIMSLRPDEDSGNDSMPGDWRATPARKEPHE